MMPGDDNRGGLEKLLALPAATLKDLANAFREGSLRYGVSQSLLSPFAGRLAGDLATTFEELIRLGCPTTALAGFCDAFHTAKERMEASEDKVDLALSGPEIPTLPVVSTPAVVRGLFEEAQRDVLIASYVFQDARHIFAPLAARLDADPSFRVRIIVDLTHQRRTPDEPLPIVANRFRNAFCEQHWAGTRKPDFWHDPRKFLDPAARKSGVMHAKVVVIDESVALVTSANFTRAAQDRNIEVGVVLRHRRHVRQLKAFFDALIADGFLKPV